MQDMTFELQRPLDRVVEPLHDVAALLDLLLGPHPGEAGRHAEELGHELVDARVGGVAGIRGLQDGDRSVNVSSEVGSIGSMTDPDSPMWPMASVPYPASKAALNMVTVMYAKQLRESGIKVNAANPGYCATDLNNNSGFRTAEQGAEVTVHLATLPDDGPTGTFWGYLWRADGTESYGVLPW